LASISGGTDIVSCFVGGQPNGPVWRGEIQGAALGMDVDVVRRSRKSLDQAPGELVCRTGVPVDADGILGRPGRRESIGPPTSIDSPACGVTAIGFDEPEHGGFIIFGRSDATLNPGGVRIGTAEIYRQVEQLPEVLESLAVGQAWDGDERIVLFVRLAEGMRLDEALRKKIGDRIRSQTTPRHVPARIVQVADIPRTKSGKIVEIAVRHVIHGRSIANLEALANPEALDLFQDLPELRS
jgi:acetoacetyl-CoA synthetase